MSERQILVTLTVTEAEYQNLLARLTGTVGPTAQINFSGGEAAAGDDDNDPVNANAPTTDSRGIPYNSEFHSEKKSLNADGTWRNRRGVDKTKLAAWEQTAVQQAAAPAETFTLPASLAGGQPVQLPASAPAAAPVVGLPGMPAPVFPAPQAAPADVPVTMDDITNAFGKIGNMGLIQPDGSNIAAIWAKLGITDANVLNTDETKRRAVMAELRAAFPTAGL